MKLKKKYKDLNDTLHHLKLQIVESIPFAEQYLPDQDLTPKEIFKILKKDTVYINDPPGVELIQSMATMMSYSNPHNVWGAGDCDCFTVTASACLLSRGYPVDIVLVGRNRDNAVHIYNYTGIHNPVICFDLTNPRYGMERFYPYKQKIPLLP